MIEKKAADALKARERELKEEKEEERQVCSAEDSFSHNTMISG
jgi:hypothetical protein